MADPDMFAMLNSMAVQFDDGGGEIAREMAALQVALGERDRVVEAQKNKLAGMADDTGEC